MKYSIVLVAALIASTSCAKLPSSFQKCNRNEPNIKDCVLKAAQNGLSQLSQPFKEVNLPNVEPLEVLELTIGAGTSTVAVDQYFKNCKLWGLSKTELYKFEFNFEAKNIDAAALIPEIKMVCDYELDGKILLLPIKGKGPSTIILKNINATVIFPYTEVKKKNKTYFKFDNTDFKFEPNFVSFNFENLFEGNKELGDNINKVLNENWKDVFEDVREGYQKGFSLIAEGLVNSLFSKLSVEEALD